VTAARDAVVVGSGPNGLAAALTLARAGVDVRLIEGAPTLGGGCRTQELTLPGFRHDVCSAVHPLAAASPFFRSVPLAAHGVNLVQPPLPLAHPLDGGRAAVLDRSVRTTASAFSDKDARAYRRMMMPLVGDADALVELVLSPIRRPPRHPASAAHFAMLGIGSVTRLARRFTADEPRALLAGLASHAILPLDTPGTAAFGLLLATLGHVVGWPFVAGGSEQLVSALRAELEAAGATIETGNYVERLEEVEPARAILLDVGPAQLLAMAGDRLPLRYRHALRRYAYGPGVCKVDWALSGPVPWTAPACRHAGTVHVGGTFEEIASSEAEVAIGRHPDRPFVLVAQPGVADPTRAPAGHHTLWGYCHVPNGSTIDMTDRIEAQIERFAPGWRDLIIGRAAATACDVALHDRNYEGGDINGGAGTLMQTVFRPIPRWNPYRTPVDGVYLCSSSTPPGGGVHGMCGLHAATAALAGRYDIKRTGRGGRT
jgi:phytoene dehydrogenase-like protein